jgi:hypothetical protein
MICPALPLAARSFTFVLLMSDKNPYIRQGASFEFFFVGIFLMVVILIFVLAIHPLWALLFIPAISVVRSSKGAEFDVKAFRIKLYYNLLGYRLGGWTNYMSNDELWLHKSSYYESRVFRSSRYYVGGDRSYYFDVHLVRQDAESIELGAFSSYLEAHAFLQKWSGILGLPAVDHFGAEVIESLERNRSGRRR